MLQLTEEVSAVTYKNRFWLSSVFNQGEKTRETAGASMSASAQSHGSG
jgi:hypothetical protein